MFIKTIDVRNQPCPVPVIETKKTIEEAVNSGNKNAEIVVLVSNYDQVMNVVRMVERAGWRVSDSKVGNHFEIKLQAKIETTEIKVQSQDLVCRTTPQITENNRVIVIGSESMGRGSEKLGKVLIRAFLGVLKELDSKPETIVFINHGVKLVVQGSHVLNEVQELQDDGIEILVCGTCLDFLGIKDQLQAGVVSNMYDIATAMLKAGNAVVM